MMSELEIAEAKLKTQLSKPIPGTPAAVEEASGKSQADPSASAGAKKLDANMKSKASSGKEVKRGKSVEKKSTKAATAAKK